MHLVIRRSTKDTVSQLRRIFLLPAEKHQKRQKKNGYILRGLFLVKKVAIMFVKSGSAKRPTFASRPLLQVVVFFKLPKHNQDSFTTFYCVLEGSIPIVRWRASSWSGRGGGGGGGGQTAEVKIRRGFFLVTF